MQLATAAGLAALLLSADASPALAAAAKSAVKVQGGQGAAAWLQHAAMIWTFQSVSCSPALVCISGVTNREPAGCLHCM
jgi:hypothetical protein